MRRGGRLRVGQRFAVVTALLATVLTLGIVVGALGLHRLSVARVELLDRIGPARTGAVSLQNAYLNQETGIRGYLISGDRSYLVPYARGRANEREQRQLIERVLRYDVLERERAPYAAVLAAAREWRQRFVVPTLQRARTAQGPSDATGDAGKALFDRLRQRFVALQDRLNTERDGARSRLNDAADDVTRLLIIVAILLALCVVGAAIFVRRAITVPLSDLAREVRRVAGGDFGAEIDAHGPADIVELGDDVDQMRARINEELLTVRAVTTDLERSNAELEQFAYVASHDLQEPLRKVASFTQMLQRKYEGQLDDKADQYIFFAVDGAKRMQVLINDLLAFSRVGRLTTDHSPVPLREVIDRAVADLGGAVEESGARIVLPPDPPVVHVDASLMALVFQNLIGNAIKFRAEGTSPTIDVAVTRLEAEWEIAIHDDGIGIEDEYADRIFIIFQRLHPKERYGGTGIGLAMCRKIVEYHGGRIWLDTAPDRTGTTFHFTLPIAQETPRR